MRHLWFLIPFFHLVSCEQEVLTLKELNAGLLRRFNTETSEVLNIAQRHNLDIWHATKSFIDVYFPPNEGPLPEELERLPHNTTAISTKPPSRPALSTEWDVVSPTKSTFHNTYHPLDEISSFLLQLANTFPNVTRLTNIGNSAEGRPIQALTISSGPYHPLQEKKKKKKKKKGGNKTPTIDDSEKLGFVIVGAQHAREWIATATSVYLSHALVSNTSEPFSLSPLLAKFDFHIVPVPNPDGYDYTWETDRYWYKNRQVLGPHEKCVGLDMNRNWGYKWKRTPVNGDFQPDVKTKPREPINPCSHWYPGTRPFESPEVNNLANWVATLPNLVGFIDLRSYGQMLSSPYSYTCKTQPKDAEDQVEAALGATHALQLVHGTTFQTGPLCSMLYSAPGNILDWMYARESVKYSYVAHLRDTGTYGFSLPEKWIRPTGEETGELVDYLAKFIAKQAKRPF